MMRFQGSLTTLLFILSVFFGLSSSCTRKKPSRHKDPSERISLKQNLAASIPTEFENCKSLEVEIAKRRAMSPKSQNSTPNTPKLEPRTTKATVEQQFDEAATQQQSWDTQEKNVLEGDKIASGEDIFYVAAQSSVQVFDRKSLKLLGAFPTDDLIRVRLFLYQSKLIVLGQAHPIPGIGTPSPQTPNPIPSEGTLIRIYETFTDKVPELISEKNFETPYVEARLVGKHLYFVAATTLSHEGTKEKTQLLAADGKLKGVSCAKVVRPLVDDSDLSYLSVTSLSISEPDAVPQRIAILGGADRIYMTSQSLYIAKEHIAWHPAELATLNSDSTAPSPSEFKLSENLHITKIRFDALSGALHAAAAGVVAGRTKGRWSFHEDKETETLFVATSEGVLQLPLDHPDVARNHVFALQQCNDGLNIVGQVKNIALNEEIRAVRYYGKFVYLVTFRQTDPLFAIDITRPEKMHIAGELNVPGFSVALHPWKNNFLIGIGFETEEVEGFSYAQGIQVSLFDINSPHKLARMDSKTFGNRGSYSDATNDSHAILIDEEVGLLGIPIVALHGEENKKALANELQFSGLVLFKPTLQGLSEVARVSHKDLIPAHCDLQLSSGTGWSSNGQSIDIHRALILDQRVVTVSAFGLKAHEVENPSLEITSVPFSPQIRTCPFPIPENRPQ
jgi:inhibitor of cysteine peptidase